MTMPKVDLKQCELTDAEAALVARFVKKDGTIRASKPTLPRKTVRVQDGGFLGYHMAYATAEGVEQGKAAYAWRMLVFAVSSEREHQCMPMTADFSLAGTYDEVRALAKELDALVDKVMRGIPVVQWAGVRRWGNALGLIGTPEIAPDGSRVYR